MFRVCLIPLFVGLAAVSTQERGSVQSPGASTPVFSSRAELVVAHVTVKDRQGAYVRALAEEAFRIFEDGTPQRIEFFRPVRRIQAGDEIRFVTGHGTFRYRVRRHTVVDPDALWVLDASPAAALTLITCYPFNYVGPAPRRFIVHAERMANVSESSYETVNREGNTQ